MIRAIVLLVVLGAAAAHEMVVDFENAAVVLPPNQASNRVEKWESKGVTFTLANEPEHTKAKGMLTFFAHLSSGRKGIVCAMAAEPIPVRATFPVPVSSVTVSMWGSTATPALLEAFDSTGKVVDRASLESVPGRKAPGDAVPIFNMTVKGARIAYVQWSGAREGEYLAATEVRFTPAEGADLR
jgi:hypothetical protein